MAQLENRYANALFELSIENNSVKADLAEAQLVRDSLELEETQAFLLHPHVSDAAKLELLKTAFADLINVNLAGFLQLLIEKNRETVLLAVLDDYINKVNKYLGRVEAKVVSATALSDKQMAMLHPLIAKITKKETKIRNVVDPDVIGGFYILVDGHVFDATIRSDLHKMKAQLKKGGRNAS